MTTQSTDKEVVLEGLLGIPFFEGNRIDVLKNGVEIFPAMLDAIEGARESIEFLTFVYWQGDIAVRFAEALADRSRAGVAVRVMLDSFGARPMRHDLIELMSEAGADVRWFRPLETWRVWTMDNRTHRKILIVDGRTGFTGGVGIADCVSPREAPRARLANLASRFVRQPRRFQHGAPRGKRRLEIGPAENGSLVPLGFGS